MFIKTERKNRKAVGVLGNPAKIFARPQGKWVSSQSRRLNFQRKKQFIPCSEILAGKWGIPGENLLFYYQALSN